MQNNITPALATPPSILEVQDIVTKLDGVLLDVDQFYTHALTNSLDAYYHQLIDSVVLDLTVIPVNQEIMGLAPIDDEGSVNAGLVQLSEMLAQVFNKTPHDVEHDVFDRMSTFPIDDTRTSCRLQHTNRLN